MLNWIASNIVLFTVPLLAQIAQSEQPAMVIIDLPTRCNWASYTFKSQMGSDSQTSNWWIMILEIKSS